MPNSLLLNNMKETNHGLLRILISKMDELITRVNIMEERLVNLESTKSVKPKSGWIFT
jgi:hypothetical protein